MDRTSPFEDGRAGGAGRAVLLLLALGAASQTGGCAVGVAGAALGGANLAFQDRSLGRGLDDSAAVALIKGKLLRSDGGFAGVNVSVMEGHVVLNGAVPTPEHRALAEQTAWSLESVRGVTNNLEVGPQAGLWRTARDQWISGEVRAALVADAEVKSINFNIDTYRGVVYLMGVARTQAELERAARAASHARGVEKVVSYVVVRRSETASVQNLEGWNAAR